MLKIKHFLMALSFIPLSLTALQLPTSAQFVPSKGVAGFNSGQNGGGSAGLTFTNTTGGTNSFQIVITQQDILAGISDLQNGGLLGSQTASQIKESLAALFSSNEIGSSTVTQNPTDTADGRVSYTDSKGTKTGILYPKAPPGLTQDAVLSIVTLGASVGASNDQIRAAVNIAATGAGSTATYKMLLTVAALFATVKTANVETDLKVSYVADESQDTSLKLKSFARNLLIAQAKSVTVDAGALAAAIDSYNDLLAGSTPATVSKLSDNKPFMKVGGALRSMRSAFD